MAFLPDNRRDDEFIKIFRRLPFDHIFAGLLHTRGACINQKDSKGYSPVLFSARIGNVQALSWLQVRGADLEAVDTLGSSALHIAAINSNLDTVAWLLQYTKLGPNPKNKIGSFFLFFVFLFFCFFIYFFSIRFAHTRERAAAAFRISHISLSLTFSLSSSFAHNDIYKQDVHHSTG